MFTLRPDKLGRLRVYEWLDVTPVAGFKTADEYEKTLDVLKRLGEDTEELTYLTSVVGNMLGSMGTLRLRLNSDMTGPFMVRVEEPVEKEDIEAYVCALSESDLRQFMREAKI